MAGSYDRPTVAPPVRPVVTRPRRSPRPRPARPAAARPRRPRCGRAARPRRRPAPNSSEAPLITIGWPVKPGADATNPTTLTTLTTFSRPTRRVDRGEGVERAHAGPGPWPARRRRPRRPCRWRAACRRPSAAGRRRRRGCRTARPARRRRPASGDLGQREAELGELGVRRSVTTSAASCRPPAAPGWGPGSPRPAPSRPRPSCRGSAWSRGPAAGRSTYSHFCMRRGYRCRSDAAADGRLPC